MSLDPALRTRIETLLSGNRIVLFMKGEPSAPQCGFSAKSVAALAELGADYMHVNVLADAAIREGIKEYGDWPTIPQLYVGGELVGGSDIIEQMVGSGELHSLLGLAAPDRTPPSITITPAAAQMLREAVANAGDGFALQVDIDPHFTAKLQLAPVNAQAIAVEAEGLRAQFDLASARRAPGLRIDWVDDERGRGLVIDNPNAPPKVQPLTAVEARERAAAGTLTLVDVRSGDERDLAAINEPYSVFDGDGMAHLEALDKAAPLAFLCHHGGRSAQAAEHFRGLGFRNVFNVEGGIEAWAELADPHVARY